MLTSVAIAPLNHMLRGESWARKRLQPCAGKTARFRVPPFFYLAVAIQPTAEVAVPSTPPGNDTGYPVPYPGPHAFAAAVEGA